MRILVTGGRNFENQELLFKTLDELHVIKPISVVIHGNAKGADKLADKWASSKHIKTEVYPANWDKHGRSAGPIRNQQMLSASPDMVIAFPGGRGTADMVNRSKKAGLEVLEIEQQ